MGVYQRGNAWYLDFLFKGQRVRESLGPITRKLAEAVLQKRKVAIIEEKYLDKREQLPPLSFHEMGVRYVAWSKANHKELTHHQNICMLRRLEKEFRNKNIQEITQWQLEQWKSRRKEMVKVRGKGQGEAKIGPSCLNAEIRFLKHFFSKAVEWGFCKTNPTKGVKLAKGEKVRTNFLSLTEVQKFLSCCIEPLKSIVMMILHTGLRKGEVLGLTWDNVNFGQGLITVTELNSKSNKMRQIPINDTAQQMLKELPHYGNYVFAQPNGKRYVSVEKMLRRAREKSGLEGVTLHELRRTFASHLAMANVDLITIKELLGHSSLQMVMHYAHLSPAHKAHAVSILDKKLMSQNFNEEKPSAAVIKLKR